MKYIWTTGMQVKLLFFCISRPSETLRAKRASTSQAAETSNGGTKRPARSVAQKVSGLLEKIEAGYEADSQATKDIGRNITAANDISTFYKMISERIAVFSRGEQLWMEGEIWKLYLQMESKSTEYHKNRAVRAHPNLQYIPQHQFHHLPQGIHPRVRTTSGMPITQVLPTCSPFNVESMLNYQK